MELQINIFRFLCLCILLCIGNCKPGTKFKCNSPVRSDAVNRRSYKSRISGGRPMDTIDGGYNAFIAGIKMSCSGSIIGQKWILSAGHCYTDSKVLTVYVGSNYKFKGKRFDVKKVHVHPQYVINRYSHYYDYILLELKQDLEYSQSVWAIPLAEDDTIKEGIFGTVSGFGFTSENNTDLNEKLRSVALPVIGHEKCLEYYSSESISHDHIFCAGFDNERKSACKGDSGGPFVVKGKLVGVTIGVEKCGMPRTPTVFTSVYIARPWICQIAGI